MAVWSEALVLTANCLSPLPVRILAGACGKVTSDLRLGNCFRWVLGFLHHLQLASQELASTWQKK